MIAVPRTWSKVAKRAHVGWCRCHSTPGSWRCTWRGCACPLPLLGKRIRFARRDDADGSVLPKVVPRPRRQDGKPIPEPDQVVDVDDQPRQPAEEAREPERAGLGDGGV